MQRIFVFILLYSFIMIFDVQGNRVWSEKINSCECKFEWLSISGFLYKGKIYYKKDIGIRIELRKPPEKVIIANRRHLIVIDRTEHVIGIQRLRKRKDFSNFLGILKFFSPQKKQDHIYWYPKDDYYTNWKAIRIKEGNMQFPSYIEILTKNGITKIWFKDVKLNISIPNNIFYLSSIPSTYQIIPNPYKEEEKRRE